MQSSIFMMNIPGDFGFSGSYFKKSNEVTGSGFKDFLISADKKLSQNNYRKNTDSSSGLIRKSYSDGAEGEKSIKSEKLPEYKIRKCPTERDSNSKRNSVTVQENEENLFGISDLQPPSDFTSLIFNSNLLNQMETDGTSFNNALADEFIKNVVSNTSTVSEDQKMGLSQNDLTLTNGGNEQDLKFIQKLVEMLQNNNQLSKINLSKGDLENILNLLNNLKGNDSVNLSDITDIEKSFLNNLEQLKSVLENSGLKLNDSNIKEVNFNDLNKAGTIISEKAVPASSDIKSDLLNSFSKMMDSAGMTSSIDKESFELLKNNFQPGFDNLIKNVSVETGKGSGIVEQIIEPQTLIDTVVKDITHSLTHHKMELEVKLMPENLGKITIKVSMEEGKLNANIEVKNTDVKQVIENNLVKMRDDLNQNGINLEKINIFLSDSNQFANKQERFFQQSKPNSKNIPDEIEIENTIGMVKNMGYNTVEYVV